jgi:hypothetical protein
LGEKNFPIRQNFGGFGDFSFANCLPVNPPLKIYGTIKLFTA